MKIGFVLSHEVNILNGRPSLDEEHMLRLTKGLELYNNGIVDKLVVTTNITRKYPHSGTPMHELSAEWLREKKVPEEDILRIPDSRSTVEEVTGLSPLLREYKPEEVHLVTSDYHIARAVASVKTAYPSQKFIPHTVETNKPEESWVLRARDATLIRIWRLSPRIFRWITDLTAKKITK